MSGGMAPVTAPYLSHNSRTRGGSPRTTIPGHFDMGVSVVQSEGALGPKAFRDRISTLQSSTRPGLASGCATATPLEHVAGIDRRQRGRENLELIVMDGRCSRCLPGIPGPGTRMPVPSSFRDEDLHVQVRRTGPVSCRRRDHRPVGRPRGGRRPDARARRPFRCRQAALQVPHGRTQAGAPCRPVTTTRRLRGRRPAPHAGPCRRNGLCRPVSSSPNATRSPSGDHVGRVVAVPILLSSDPSRRTV